MTLHFNPGNYQMWFTKGADLMTTGNSFLSSAPGATAQMYFYGTSSNTAEMKVTGNSDSTLPSGEYYFDHGKMQNTGNAAVYGEDMFFYFKNGSTISSTGNAQFAFTPPTDEIYDGYLPGVLFYSDPDNTSTFNWTGNTAAGSSGVIYLPGAEVKFTGNSAIDVFEGQFIANNFDFTGNTHLNLKFHEYVPTSIPTLYLVE